MKTVSVIGLGYVGLPTAILLAEAGWTVFGYDVDQKKINHLQKGVAPLEERELAERLAPVIKNKSLTVSSTLKNGAYFIVAVPTPCTSEKKIDFSYVENAATKIGKVLKKNDVVIIESTISVGATHKVATILEKTSGLKKGVDFFVAYCPERVLPGNAFHELTFNSRIIGGINEASGQKAQALYATFVQGECVVSNDTSAELVKLVENSFRDVSLAFANQVAAMSRACNVDPFSIIELANKHPRVSILQPGCGVGGHCLPIDPWFLIESFPAQTTLLHEARKINDRRPYEVYQEVSKAIKKAQQQVPKPRVLLLGLSYKADSDDFRSSPALEVALLTRAHSHECELKVWEPHLPATDFAEYGLSSKAEDERVDSFDIIIALVKHTAFMSVPNFVTQKNHVLDFCSLMYKKSLKKTFRGAQSVLTEDSREASLKGIQQPSSTKLVS